MGSFELSSRYLSVSLAGASPLSSAAILACSIATDITGENENEREGQSIQLANSVPALRRATDSDAEVVQLVVGTIITMLFV